VKKTRTKYTGTSQTREYNGKKRWRPVPRKKRENCKIGNGNVPKVEIRDT